jgi:phosphate:Na+ symporter
MTSTLHALDHTSRLIEVLADNKLPTTPAAAPYDLRAAELCIQAMRAAQAIGGSIASETALSMEATPIGWSVSPEVDTALADVENAAKGLEALQRDHRATTLAAVAPGKLTAADAFARIEAARRLDRIAHHAWRSAAHLLGRGEHSD